MKFIKAYPLFPPFSKSYGMYKQSNFPSKPSNSFISILSVYFIGIFLIITVVLVSFPFKIYK